MREFIDLIRCATEDDAWLLTEEVAILENGFWMTNHQEIITLGGNFWDGHEKIAKKYFPEDGYLGALEEGWCRVSVYNGAPKSELAIQFLASVTSKTMRKLISAVNSMGEYDHYHVSGPKISDDNQFGHKRDCLRYMSEVANKQNVLTEGLIMSEGLLIEDAFDLSVYVENNELHAEWDAPNETSLRKLYECIEKNPQEAYYLNSMIFVHTHQALKALSSLVNYLRAKDP